jgi:hypothetical protein
MSVLFRVLFCLCIAVGAAAAQDLDPQAVKTAIQRGVTYLKRHQGADGAWSQFANNRCGQTALALIAMQSCGVKSTDPSIQAGMKYLRMFPGKDAGQIYSLALQTMAFSLIEPQKNQQLIKDNVRLIEHYQNSRRGEHQGGWHYTPDASTDLSCSQFAILALYEAERAGVKIQPSTWSAALRYWRDTQNQDGSWGYSPQNKEGSAGVRGSMTCAGIASLVVVTGTLHRGGADVKGRAIMCHLKPEKELAQKIELGLEWLAEHFSVATNPNAGTYLFYYLYGLERVGRMTNQRFIGRHDWYREGTAKILQLQDPIDGGWRGTGCPEESETAFALLFLSKGRRPVLMSKLETGDSPSWNMHPNDVNNLTLFAELNWKQEMTWQTVNMEHATADHLLQSPVLYLSGKTADGLLTNDNVEKLRIYLDQGGFLIAEAQPNDQTFDSGFRELMSKVFPEPGYELQLLDRNHPVWNAEIAIAPEQIRRIEGIQFGCRTSVVYIPREKITGTDKYKPSLSCLWEIAQLFDRENKYHEDVTAQVEAGLGIGLNILAYATNRELKHKDEIAEHVVKRQKHDSHMRGRIFLPYLDFGSSNPAPNAVSNLLTYMEAELQTTANREHLRVTPTKEELTEYPIVFMHGKEAFTLTDDQRKGLNKYLQNGGFLFANAICSSKAFADSLFNEMKTLFPDLTFDKIPLDDPIFASEHGGFKLDFLNLRVTERTPEQRAAAKTRQIQPELYGLKLPNADRWIAVFSPYDVSCALEKAGSIECRGYTNESALKLAANVILYAIEHW